MRPRSLGAWTDGKYGTVDVGDNLLRNGAENETGKASASVGPDDEEVYFLVFDESAQDFKDFALLDPAVAFDSIELAIAFQPGDVLLAVAAGGLVNCGNHFRQGSELGRLHKVEQMKGGSKLPCNGHSMHDSAFGAIRKVGCHRYILNRNVTACFYCHLRF